ncbi:hypothetical protein ACFOET_11025 [Parapedobacter deserti]|uniref:Uncharacterized protein n=1 Tax=Parapedobacter deserti TaxID=1912957 RepID=A0ABV7JP88_9SPHI
MEYRYCNRSYMAVYSCFSDPRYAFTIALLFLMLSLETKYFEFLEEFKDTNPYYNAPIIGTVNRKH